MTRTTINLDNAQDLTFDGGLLGSASSRRTTGPCSQRWTELHLYKTKQNYICVTVGRTRHDNEADRYTAEVILISDQRDSKYEVMKYFGFGILGKSLWHDLGWNAVREVL
jgi:hypothetical protein